MFIESPRFPENVSYGAAGGPGFATDVVVLSSAFEQRNATWDVSRCEYDVSHNIKSQSQLDDLIVFFRIAKGRAHGFRFKDWTDYQVAEATSRLLLVSGSTYQLQKVYAHVGGADYRDITKPVEGTVVVYSNGSPYGSASVDYTTGLVVVTGSPGTLTWSGEFDVPCRFDTDKMKAVVDDTGVYSWGSIPVVEVRYQAEDSDFHVYSRAAALVGRAPVLLTSAVYPGADALAITGLSPIRVVA